MTRHLLPHRREAHTFNLRWANNDYVVSVGVHEDGSLAETFINGAKIGSEMQALVRDAAILLSLALQHGCPVSTMAGAITRDGIDTPQSIIGALLDEMIGEAVRVQEERGIAQS